jgi:hypothetical protein
MVARGGAGGRRLCHKNSNPALEVDKMANDDGQIFNDALLPESKYLIFRHYSNINIKFHLNQVSLEHIPKFIIRLGKVTR